MLHGTRSSCALPENIVTHKLPFHISTLVTVTLKDMGVPVAKPSAHTLGERIVKLKAKARKTIVCRRIQYLLVMDFLLRSRCS
jgi:hypothetical protein